MRQLHLPMPIWDAPTRLFHWAIAILVCWSWLTQEMGWMELHVLSGYAVLSMLLFRLAWGVIGSETSRFARFLRSPAAALRHLSHIRRREPDYEIGHNAAGGWMVLVMLALLLIQAGTGLFSNDDVATEGPLMHVVGKARSDWLTHIHDVNFTLIEIAVAMHVAAIAAYALLKGQNLVRPMITGKKRVPGATRAPRMASSVLASVILVVAVGAVALLTRLAP